MVFTHAGEKTPFNNQTFPVFKPLKAKKGNDTQCWWRHREIDWWAPPMRVQSGKTEWRDFWTRVKFLTWIPSMQQCRFWKFTLEEISTTGLVDCWWAQILCCSSQQEGEGISFPLSSGLALWLALGAKYSRGGIVGLLSLALRGLVVSIWSLLNASCLWSSITLKTTMLWGSQSSSQGKGEITEAQNLQIYQQSLFDPSGPAQSPPDNAMCSSRTT